jgi:hypothetical protein
MPSRISTFPDLSLSLQTLSIVRVARLTSIRSSTDSRTRVSNPATLSPVRLRGTTGSRSLGSRSSLSGTSRRHFGGRRGNLGRAAGRLGRASRLDGAARASTTNRLPSRPNIAPANVREDNVRIWVLSNDVGWVTLGAAAGSVASAVEPVHVAAGVVPDAEGEDHAAAEGGAHIGQSAEVGG